MSSSRHPWVPNLQLPSLRNFTLHKPLPFASRCKYCSDYGCEGTTEIVLHRSTQLWKPQRRRRLHTPPRAVQRLYSADHAHHVPSMCRYTSGFSLTRLNLLTNVIHVSPCLRHCWCHLLALATDVIFWLWGFDRWIFQVWPLTLIMPLTLTVNFSPRLTFSVQVLLIQFFT